MTVEICMSSSSASSDAPMSKTCDDALPLISSRRRQKHQADLTQRLTRRRASACVRPRQHRYPIVQAHIYRPISPPAFEEEVEATCAAAFWQHIEEVQALCAWEAPCPLVAELTKLSLNDDNVKASFRLRRPMPLDDCVISPRGRSRSRSRSPNREVEIVVERKYWDGLSLGDGFDTRHTWMHPLAAPLMIRDCMAPSSRPTMAELSNDATGFPPTRLSDDSLQPLYSILDGFGDA
eukprot:GEMP01064775.1.p1 GENE.GEMP01064775.1~~GEMP01064775.1.p1  ORF type:complete len:236 (+),score=51.65 GEMP01064775.1:150-857(+)